MIQGTDYKSAPAMLPCHHNAPSICLHLLQICASQHIVIPFSTYCNSRNKKPPFRGVGGCKIRLQIRTSLKIWGTDCKSVPSMHCIWFRELGEVKSVPASIKRGWEGATSKPGLAYFKPYTEAQHIRSDSLVVEDPSEFSYRYPVFHLVFEKNICTRAE